MRTPGEFYQMSKNKRYVAGKNFESRFLAELKEKKISVKSGRFYASRGVTDVWWVDQKGTHHEAQLKYSSTKPYIAAHEMRELKKFATEVKDQIKVWLVLKQKRQPIDMRLIV